MLLSLEYLKELAELAKEALAAEREVVPAEDQGLGKPPLPSSSRTPGTRRRPSSLNGSSLTSTTLSRRFPEWQHTDEGERTVKQAPRCTLLKYKLHRDQGLFEKASGYIKQYY